jgi:membrane-associated protein
LAAATTLSILAAVKSLPTSSEIWSMANLSGRPDGMVSPWARTCAASIILLSAATYALAQSAAPAAAQAPATEEPGFVMLILQNLFNSRALLAILSRPEFTLTAFIALNVIVFLETGLLVFCLPGDSLLVTAGVACYLANWDLPLLLATLCLAAVIGDSVGYAIGWRTGTAIFTWDKSWLFNKEHLLKAHAFYEKHGGKTIILARFMPIIRTFAPVVAGAAQMQYRTFLYFNVIGGMGWVLSMVLIGYTLSTTINPTFQYLLGNPSFDVQDHIEKVVIVVVLLSISPALYAWLQNRRARRSPSIAQNSAAHPFRAAPPRGSEVTASPSPLPLSPPRGEG